LETKTYLTIFAFCTLSCAYWIWGHYSWWLLNLSLT
jgi:hypothetical protein